MKSCQCVFTVVVALSMLPAVAIAQFDGDTIVDEMDQIGVLLSGNIMTASEAIRTSMDSFERNGIQSLRKGLSTTAEQSLIMMGAEIRGTIAFALTRSEDGPDMLERMRKAFVTSIAPHAVELILHNGTDVERRDMPPTILVGGYGFGTKDIHGNEKVFVATLVRDQGNEDISQHVLKTSPMTIQINISEVNGVAFKPGDKHIELELDGNIIGRIPIVWSKDTSVADGRKLSLEIYTGKDDKDDDIYFTYQVRRNDMLIASGEEVGKDKTWDTDDIETINLPAKNGVLPGIYRIDVYAYGKDNNEWDAKIKAVATTTATATTGEIKESSVIFDRHFQPAANNTGRKHLVGFWRW